MTDAAPQVAKIKLKVGSMELEYEGNPSFLTEGIETLLVTMGGLVGKVPDGPPPEPDPASQMPPANGSGNGGGAASGGGAFNFSTSTIAAHLNSKSGPELAICAMAQLELTQGKSTSQRGEILAQMRMASSYYNENMASNLSKILSGLVKAKRVNEIAKDTYALNANERKQIEAKVADIG